MTSRFSTITIPDNVSIVLVDTRNVQEVLYLPVVSTNQGRLLFFKDYYGTSSNSTITFSTIGTDTIDDFNFQYTFSNTFGSMTFMSDGLRSWRTISLYDGSLTPSSAPVLSVLPAVRYSFLSTNYPGSGNVNNIGSNTAVGSATVVRNSYTAASPGFITTSHNTSHYVQAPSQSAIQTIIMIVRVFNGSPNSYLLDARDGLPNGWMWSGGTGGDWLGQTYYRDCILTSVPNNIPGSLQDNQWHHVCFIRAAFTDNVTYLSRFSQNESIGADTAEIMAFSQALTLQQVKDNFNFFASRFGWTPVS